MLRLMTPRGELASLGHPEYGSKLHELSGSSNTDTTRSLLRLHIIECLRMEKRISEICAVHIETDHNASNIVNVRLEIVPVNEAGTLVIGPFSLEFES
jgi:phage baseplate assembly protein W